MTYRTFSEAEAVYKGVNIKGWRRYFNKATVRGKNGVIFSLLGTFVAIGIMSYLNTTKAAREGAKQQKIDDYNNFVQAKNDWFARGKKFSLAEWKEL